MLLCALHTCGWYQNDTTGGNGFSRENICLREYLIDNQLFPQSNYTSKLLTCHPLSLRGYLCGIDTGGLRWNC